MTTTTAPRVPLMRRARTVLLAILLAATTFVVLASPTDLARPEALQPDTAAAYGCADGPAFHGWLTNSTSSHPVIDQSTDGWVYGYISNVDDDWSCTYWWRYDGLAWTRKADGSKGNFAWGTLIHSQSVSCNWAIGSTDYLKANSTSDCPDTDAEYAHHIRLKDTDTGGVLDGIYHQDASPDALGDFMFIHSSCETYYGASPTSWNENFNSGNEDNRPGAANCDPTDLDGTNTTQAISVDTTPPTGISISINDGAAATNDPSVTLGGIAATDSVSGVADMRFSNNGSTWSSWEPYSASRAAAWDLTTATYGGTSADGTRTVYVQFRDALGNYPSTAISATIELDRTAPSPPSTPDLDPASDTGASDTDDITSDRTPTFNGTAAPGVTVTVTAGAYALPPGQASLQDGSWSVTAATDLDPGEYAVTATATDDVGNTSLTSSALDVTITDSDVNLVWPADGATLFATETLEVSGLPPGMTSVTYLVDGVSVGSVSAVPWTLDWDTTTATDDAHTVHAEATTASGTASSQIATVTVDNTLASTERLDLDYAAGRITLDEYAVNGVYATEAPLALPGRYPAPVAATIDADVLTYLADWDALSVAAEDEIAAFYSQPLRGSAYAEALYPTTRAATHPTGITDPCEQVEVRSFPEDPVPLGTKIECVRESDHFIITYRVDATGIFDPADVVVLDAGVPTIIGQYKDGLEHAYAVYTTELGYVADWPGKVPVDIHVPPCGDLCGFVGDPLEVLFGHAQVIQMAPKVGTPYYLAHHELFHVFQGSYVPAINPFSWLAYAREGLPWLFESTAEWAAGYVTRAGHPEDAAYYADRLPIFLARPDDLQLRHTDGVGGREYGAWILHEYFNERFPTADHNFVRRVLEKLEADPSDPLTLIDRVLADESTSLAAELPAFWRANYLLEYNDTVGAYTTDVEAVWRASLARPEYPATNGDEGAPARPKRDPVQLTDGVLATQGATVERGGARFIEFWPAATGSAGTFTLGVSAITGSDLDVRVLVIGYPDDGAPSPMAIPPATICSETPLPYDANGIGDITVSLEQPDCDYVVMIVTNTAALGSSQAFQWWALFDRQVITNNGWKVFHLWWTGDGGTPPAEPTGWLTTGFNDAAWSDPVIRTDPYYSWADIPIADFISSPGSAPPYRLQSEIWLAREEFTLTGAPQSDASLRWTVDNKATIWINGHLLVSNAGSWTSITTTPPVPAAWLQAGQNTIAVRITQDDNTNTWSSNPTMFQAELTLPAQAP